MSKKEVESIIEVSKIHEKRLLEALSMVKDLFPLNAHKVQNITQIQFFALEALTNRFSKLQDLIGSRLFDLCLNSIGEATDGLNMIDKANKLEKTAVIDSANLWMEMRKLRNSLTHEYPNQPEITADVLNKMYAMIAPMLAIYNKILEPIQQANGV